MGSSALACPALLDRTMDSLLEQPQSLCPAFCVNQYAVDFPMFAKTELKRDPLFAED
jgi:hypothetical protein